jgi:hypothetical protein
MRGRTRGPQVFGSDLTGVHSPHGWCHNRFASGVYHDRMNATNSLNLTRNAKLLLAAAGLLLWGIGGTIDGASLRSLVSVPLFVAVWMGLIWAIDRWVRPGGEPVALSPRAIDAASAAKPPAL